MFGQMASAAHSACWEVEFLIPSFRVNVKRCGGITSLEGCTKLAHVKIYNSIVLQKKELWIFIFLSFLVYWKDFFSLAVSK